MRPVYRLHVDGQPLPVKPLSVQIIDNLGPESDLLRVTLSGLSATGDVVGHPRHGVMITAGLGFADQAIENYGKFAVTAVDFHAPPVILVITGNTPELFGENGAIKAPRTFSWDNKSLGDILSTIAQRHQLNPRLSRSLQDVRFTHVDQVGESDLAFLTRLARRSNGTFTIKDANAMIVRVGDGETLSGGKLPSHDVDLDDGDGLTWDANFLDDPNYKSVVAKWHNPNTGKEGRIQVGDGEPVYEIRHPYPSAAEAHLAALAELDEFERGVAELSLSLPGRPEIRAGHLVRCRSRHPVDGLWYVYEAQHTYDDSGLTTRLSLNAHNARS